MEKGDGDMEHYLGDIQLVGMEISEIKKGVVWELANKKSKRRKA